MRAALCRAALLACAGVVQAQEIAPYRLTGTEGYVSVRYLHDALDTSQPGASSRQAQTDLREEVFLMTHGYVYHPNFLVLDLGAGPVLQQARATSDAGETSSRDSLYNLSTRASFLRDKPYQGSLFYDHLNPTLSVSPGSVMTQENERYGADLSTRVPMPISVDASRNRNRGSSVDRVLDDRFDQVGLRASQTLGKDGLTEFRYRKSNQESESGSPNLPVQRTSVDRETSQLDTRLRLGANEEYDLFNVITYDTQSFGLSQSALPERTDRRFLLDARGRHSERLSSFGSFTRNSTDEGVTQSTLNAGTAGLNYAPLDSLALRASVRAENNRTTQLSVRSRGAEGSIEHRRALPPGQLTAGYTARFDRREQSAAAAVASVIGERLTLPGTTAVPLAQQRVVLASIVVSNTTRTQTYTEGIDYLVSVVGLTTRLERIVGGSILDGEEVLVDYDYDTGGTFSSDQLDQTLSVSWGLRNILDVYLRFLDSSPRLTSGTPTSPLNEVRSTLVGSRADVPLNLAFDLTLGGFYEHENRRETIAPFRRQHLELYAQVREPFFDNGQLRLTGRRVTQDFDNSTEDVNLTGYEARISTRAAQGLVLYANAGHERDTGGSSERSRLLAGARAQWRYRQASLTMDYTRLRETQGVFERYRRVAQILLRRDF